jgi:predicted Zn-dependent protease
MPKLSPVQWVVFIAFLAFYGFAVFAVTRDYYLRNPPRPVAASVAAVGQGDDAAQTQAPVSAQTAMSGGDTAIPPAVIQSNPILLMQKADELFGQQRYGEAIPLYRRVLELQPKSPEAHNDLGLALFYAGQAQKGLDVLRQGTAQSPDFQRLWLTLGFVSAQAGDKAAAKTALEKARSLGPDNDMGREAQRILGVLAKQ